MPMSKPANAAPGAMAAASKPQGYLMLMLHAHLPFVRHPEHPYFLEENWLYEAITETYIPLLDAFDRLVVDGVDFNITMSVTPPLAEMLADDLLQERYSRHLAATRELAEKECVRTKSQPEFLRTAEMYREKLARCRAVFEQYDGNLVAGFRRFQDLGVLEIVTCGATHGFAPVLRPNPDTVRAQIEIGAAAYEKHFGRRPRGIWNAECGYYPGLEDVLAASGIEYFFVDTHGILHAERRPRRGVFAPLVCPNGVAAFARDIESSKSVWSSKEGYPGDVRYRDFYRDIGFDLDAEYIAPYIHPDGIRVMTGIKYHRITGETDEKLPYNPADAREAAAEHAGNFMFNREKQVEHLAAHMDRCPVIVAPYDAELFGHWWYEGPMFLEYLLRKIHFDQQTIKTITPVQYLEKYPENQVARPSYSSWGNRGYAAVWLDQSNDWIYRHLHVAADRMTEMATAYAESPKALAPAVDDTGAESPNPLMRALNQAARELLLAQSSDWAFIMQTRTTVEYATKRTKDHVGRFNALYAMIKSGSIDLAMLEDMESKDNIFPEVDFRTFARR